MKRLIRLAAWLYPSPWRRRYGQEFEALLDDVGPGWQQLLDVLKGAIGMQARTIGAIIIFCGLIGTMIGVFVAMRAPEMYASSATIHFHGIDVSRPDSPAVQSLDDSVERVLRSTELRDATTVQLRHGMGNSLHTLLLTYQNRDGKEAQRMTEQLAAALATDGGGEVLNPSTVPTLISSNDGVTIASGAIVGIIAGAIAGLACRYRRPPLAPTS